MLHFGGTRHAFRRDDLTGITKDEQIGSSSSVWALKSSCGIILDLSYPEWCVPVDVLLNQQEDLPFAIFRESPMHSSVPRPVQPMREGRRGMKSWRVECSHQSLNAGRDIMGDSAASLTYALCRHQNSRRRESRSCCRNSQTASGIENSSRDDKMTSSASAGSAGIFSDILGYSTSGSDARNGLACLPCVVLLCPVRRRIACVALSLRIF
jgi:hypothetical protein